MVARLVIGPAVDAQDLENTRLLGKPFARAVARAVVQRHDAVDVPGEVRDQARELRELVAGREQSDESHAPRGAPRRRAGWDRRTSNLSSHLAGRTISRGGATACGDRAVTRRRAGGPRRGRLAELAGRAARDRRLALRRRPDARARRGPASNSARGP